MKASLAGLLNYLLDSIDQQRAGGRFVARNIVERNVAKRAAFPIAAVRYGELIPAAVALEAVHGVQHYQHREVLGEGQIGVVGRTDFGVRHIGKGVVDVLYFTHRRA